MDTTEKRKLLDNNIIVALPDDEDDDNSPSSLYMVARDLLTSWIRITPDLEEERKKLADHLLVRALSEHPEEAMEAINNKGEGDDPNRFDFMQKILNDTQYGKHLSALMVSAMLDYRETIGKEEFQEEHLVTDSEIISLFTEETAWRSYTPEEGWSESFKGGEKLKQTEDGKVLVDDT